MPGMMGMAYGMEIQHTKDNVTIYGELNDVYRRILLNGRKPSQRTLDDPTFAGYSVRHREGTRSSWTPCARTRSSTCSRRTAINSPCTRASDLRRLASSRIGRRPRIRERCSNPSRRFVRIGRHRHRTTNCASSRVRRASSLPNNAAWRGPKGTRVRIEALTGLWRVATLPTLRTLSVGALSLGGSIWAVERKS
jgi:hypothetical protein